MIHDSKNRFSVASFGFVDIHFSTSCVCHLNGSFRTLNVGHSGDCNRCFSSRDYNLHVLQPLIWLELENSMERGLDVQQIIASKNVCNISMQKPVVIISGIFGRPVTPVTCGADP